jgi:hypothetical protein
LICLPLRDASWSEVVSQFHGHGGARQALANCRIWAERYGKPDEDYQRCRVKLESWCHATLGAHLARMAEIEPRMLTDELPRCHGLPITVVRWDERIGMIDGKHRANYALQHPGLYAVLVIEARK